MFGFDNLYSLRGKNEAYNDMYDAQNEAENYLKEYEQKKRQEDINNIIDGDTIYKNGIKYRINGYDSPETYHNSSESGIDDKPVKQYSYANNISLDIAKQRVQDLKDAYKYDLEYRKSKQFEIDRERALKENPNDLYYNSSSLGSVVLKDDSKYDEELLPLYTYGTGEEAGEHLKNILASGSDNSKASSVDKYGRPILSNEELTNKMIADGYGVASGNSKKEYAQNIKNYILAKEQKKGIFSTEKGRKVMDAIYNTSYAKNKYDPGGFEGGFNEILHIPGAVVHGATREVLNLIDVSSEVLAKTSNNLFGTNLNPSGIFDDGETTKIADKLNLLGYNSSDDIVDMAKAEAYQELATKDVEVFSPSTWSKMDWKYVGKAALEYIKNPSLAAESIGTMFGGFGSGKAAYVVGKAIMKKTSKKAGEKVAKEAGEKVAGATMSESAKKGFGEKIIDKIKKTSGADIAGLAGYAASVTNQNLEELRKDGYEPELSDIGTLFGLNFVTTAIPEVHIAKYAFAGNKTVVENMVKGSLNLLVRSLTGTGFEMTQETIQDLSLTIAEEKMKNPDKTIKQIVEENKTSLLGSALSGVTGAHMTIAGDVGNYALNKINDIRNNKDNTSEGEDTKDKINIESNDILKNTISVIVDKENDLTLDEARAAVRSLRKYETSNGKDEFYREQSKKLEQRIRKQEKFYSEIKNDDTLNTNESDDKSEPEGIQEPGETNNDNNNGLQASPDDNENISSSDIKNKAETDKDIGNKTSDNDDGKDVILGLYYLSLRRADDIKEMEAIKREYKNYLLNKGASIGQINRIFDTEKKYRELEEMNPELANHVKRLHVLKDDKDSYYAELAKESDETINKKIQELKALEIEQKRLENEINEEKIFPAAKESALLDENNKLITSVSEKKKFIAKKLLKEEEENEKSGKGTTYNVSLGDGSTIAIKRSDILRKLSGSDVRSSIYEDLKKRYKEIDNMRAIFKETHSEKHKEIDDMLYKDHIKNIEESMSNDDISDDEKKELENRKKEVKKDLYEESYFGYVEKGKRANDEIKKLKKEKQKIVKKAKNAGDKITIKYNGKEVIFIDASKDASKGVKKIVEDFINIQKKIKEKGKELANIGTKKKDLYSSNELEKEISKHSSKEKKLKKEISSINKRLEKINKDINEIDGNGNAAVKTVEDNAVSLTEEKKRLEEQIAPIQDEINDARNKLVTIENIKDDVQTTITDFRNTAEKKTKKTTDNKSNDEQNQDDIDTEDQRKEEAVQEGEHYEEKRKEEEIEKSIKEYYSDIANEVDKLIQELSIDDEAIEAEIEEFKNYMKDTVDKLENMDIESSIDEYDNGIENFLKDIENDTKQLEMKATNMIENIGSYEAEILKEKFEKIEEDANSLSIEEMNKKIEKIEEEIDKQTEGVITAKKNYELQRAINYIKLDKFYKEKKKLIETNIGLRNERNKTENKETIKEINSEITKNEMSIIDIDEKINNLKELAKEKKEEYEKKIDDVFKSNSLKKLSDEDNQLLKETVNSSTGEKERAGNDTSKRANNNIVSIDPTEVLNEDKRKKSFLAGLNIGVFGNDIINFIDESKDKLLNLFLDDGKETIGGNTLKFMLLQDPGSFLFIQTKKEAGNNPRKIEINDTSLLVAEAVLSDYMLSEASSLVINDNDEIKKMMGDNSNGEKIAKDHPFGDGALIKNIAPKLGRRWLKAMGLTANEEMMTESQLEQYYMSVGAKIIQLGIIRGYFKQIGKDNPGSVNFSAGNGEAVTHMVKLNGKDMKERQKIIDEVKKNYESNLLSSILNYTNDESRVEKPYPTFTSKDKELYKSKIGNTATESETEALNKQERQEYYIDMDIMKDLVELYENDKETLFELFGYVKEKDIKKMAYEEKESAMASNSQIERSWEAAHKNYLKVKDVGRNSFYFPYFMPSTHRNFLGSSSLQPQSDKFHRFLVLTSKRSKQKRKMKISGKEITNFFDAVLQAFGVSIDKISPEERLKKAEVFFDWLTKISKPIEELDNIKEKILKDGEVEIKDEDGSILFAIEPEEVSHFLLALNNLKLYIDAKANSKDSFEQNMVIEVDGTNNGVAHKFFQFFPEKMQDVVEGLKKVGIMVFDKGEDIAGTLTEKAKNKIYDMYEQLVVNMLKNAKEEKHKFQISSSLGESLNNIFEKSEGSEDFDETVKALRDLAKDPVMTTGYASKLMTVYKSLGENLVFGKKKKDTLPTKMLEVAKNIKNEINKAKEISDLNDLVKAMEYIDKDKDIAELILSIVTANYNLGETLIDKKVIASRLTNLIKLLSEKRFEDITFKDIGLSNQHIKNLIINEKNEDITLPHMNKTIGELKDFHSFGKFVLSFASAKYGDAMVQSLEDTFGHTFEANLHLDNIAKSITHIFLYKFEKEVERFKEEKNDNRPLTISQKKEIMKNLIDFYPIFQGPMSDKENIEIINTKLIGRDDENFVDTNIISKSLKGQNTITLTSSLSKLMPSMASASVLPTQITDTANMTYAINNTDANFQNVFDAVVANIEDIDQITKLLNEGFLKSNASFDQLGSFVKKYEKTLSMLTKDEANEINNRVSMYGEKEEKSYVPTTERENVDLVKDGIPQEYEVATLQEVLEKSISYMHENDKRKLDFFNDIVKNNKKLIIDQFPYKDGTIYKVEKHELENIIKKLMAKKYEIEPSFAQEKFKIEYDKLPEKVVTEAEKRKAIIESMAEAFYNKAVEALSEETKQKSKNVKEYIDFSGKRLKEISETIAKFLLDEKIDEEAVKRMAIAEASFIGEKSTETISAQLFDKVTEAKQNVLLSAMREVKDAFEKGNFNNNTTSEYVSPYSKKNKSNNSDNPEIKINDEDYEDKLDDSSIAEDIKEELNAKCEKK